jgi:hypothetical protein
MIGGKLKIGRVFLKRVNYESVAINIEKLSSLAPQWFPYACIQI